MSTAVASDDHGDAPQYTISHCGMCLKPIIWALSARGGVKFAVDADPERGGTIALSTQDSGRVVAHVVSEKAAIGATNHRTMHSCKKQAPRWLPRQ